MGNSPTLLKFYKNEYKPGSCVLVHGASSGIGRELAKIYASRGCPMVVTGRNEKELQQLVAECHSEYSNFNIHYISGDASKEEECKKIVEFMILKCQRIDVLILAAGVSAHAKFGDLQNLDIFKKAMDINFYGYVNLTKYALPSLRTTNGQIVVISSVSGLVSAPLRSADSASKHAVHGFFDALHLEEDNNISVTLFCPPSFSGSNIALTSLSATSPTAISKPALTVEQAAQLCINGADRKIRHVVAPGPAWRRAYLAKVYPNLVGGMQKREAKL